MVESPDINADQRELDKFGDLAHRWWDPNSEFKPLHDINPLRLEWIANAVDLAGKRVLDIGCGGGILAESMALKGALVTGIDLGERALSVARLHLLESRQTVDYRLVSAESLALEQPGSFDTVTCMEMLEHVPNPASVVRACATLVKPGGQVFLSTINRNLKAYLFAIIGGEYLLQLLPRGTHDYARFRRPAELARDCRDAGLRINHVIGMSYNPFTKRFRLGPDVSVNYLVQATRETA